MSLRLLRVVGGALAGAGGAVGVGFAAARARAWYQGRHASPIVDNKSDTVPAQVFATPAESAAVLGGWVAIGPDLEITALPLIDTRPEARERGVWFARLRPRDVPAALARLGLEWPTEAHLRAAAATPGAIWIEPVTLWRSPADSAKMASAEWAARHDEQVRQRAAEAGRSRDLGARFLVNAGKTWLPGAAAGRAVNWGWFKGRDPHGPTIQPASDSHTDAHTDYSQVTWGMRRRPSAVAGVDLSRELSRELSVDGRSGASILSAMLGGDLRLPGEEF